MKRTWTFPDIPITNNRLLRMHWAARNRDAKKWKAYVRLRCGVPDYSEPQGKCRVKITVYRGRKQDKDNWYGSVKPLVDALVSNGWLRDDSTKWLDLHVEEFASRRPYWTEVELEDGIE